MITKEDLLKVFDYTTTGLYFLTGSNEDYDDNKSIDVVTIDCKLIRDFIGDNTIKSNSKNLYKAIQDDNVHFTITYHPYTDEVDCEVMLDEEVISYYDNIGYFKEAENMFASKIRNISPRLIHNPIISYEDELDSEVYRFDVILSDEEKDIFKEAVKEFIGEDLIREYLRVDQEVKLLYKKIEFVKKRI